MIHWSTWSKLEPHSEDLGVTLSPLPLLVSEARTYSRSIELAQKPAWKTTAISILCPGLGDRLCHWLSTWPNYSGRYPGEVHPWPSGLVAQANIGIESCSVIGSDACQVESPFATNCHGPLCYIPALRAVALLCAPAWPAPSPPFSLCGETNTSFILIQLTLLQFN